ncbi:MAG: glycosyltransferase family 2 protein [Propioniciclava sp.]|uniref:glycosyltransferase family 2 protein n=1 Tax=Propioniciclava sp. TaxID=2038686 RepID=UPI0039E62A0E
MAGDNQAHSARDDVVFVIPVYNEGQVVGEVIERVRAHYTHVVCVNDCSSDDSAAQIVAAGGYLVDHPINMGQGAALQTGFEFARVIPGIRYAVTFDADGQHRLEDVARMLEVIEEKGTDFVLGSRFLGTEAVGMSGGKRWLLRAAIAFSNATSGVHLTDTHNGLRVFTKRVLDEIQLTIPDMGHASEILEIIRSHRYTYTEVPVEIIYTDYSRAKGQSMINAVNIAFDTLLRKVSR